MSKKLIAVASAAALALTGLVGIAPASATAASITYSATGGAGTVADPYTAVVPASNAIIAGDTALSITVANLVPGDTVTVSSAGSAKVVGATLAASSLTKVTDYGSASLTKTVAAGGNNAVFYVYDTQVTNLSTLTIDIKEDNSGVIATSSTTKSFKATVGAAHQCTDVTVADTIGASKVLSVTFKVKDVFGNERTAANTLADSIAGGSPVDSGIATYDANRKLYQAQTTSPGNTDPFVITINCDAGAGEGSNAGLGATSLTGIIRVINNPATATANAAATAQIAALTAQLAESRSKAKSVTKKKYNTLARKWNAAFPSQKVALKK
jgi:hypothetical protein